MVVRHRSQFELYVQRQDVDVKEVGRRLGVRYVLEGSVRKALGKVRITGQLIDAVTGAHIWADRFERDLTDVFALQDDVTVAVVSAVEPKLLQTEIARAMRRRPENLTAYDLSPVFPRLYLTLTGIGMALIELRRFDEAIVVLKKALRQNLYLWTYRGLASAFAHLGRDTEAREAAARALEIDPTFSISAWVARAPPGRGGQWGSKVLIEGLRKAGLPE
jgi:tetratricopeptide (TPR) repeat protein